LKTPKNKDLFTIKIKSISIKNICKNECDNYVNLLSWFVVFFLVCVTYTISLWFHRTKFMFCSLCL
jgi:hypothetical protein